MESEGILVSLDPPSKTVNAAKLQRHLNSSDGMVAVLTVRDEGVSPFIRYEIGLCLRSRKPLLVFVEDVLPDGLIPPRVLQRRFSRSAFLRQVREHRHAVQVFTSYLGEEPPPRYQPEVSQRSCVIVGAGVLSGRVRAGVQGAIEQHGYRVVLANGQNDDAARQVEALAQADVALAFLDDSSPTTQYARGLIDGASVPTIEVTARPMRRRNVPKEFWPVHVPASHQGHGELETVVNRHIR